MTAWGSATAVASAQVREYWIAAVPVTWNVIPNGHDAIGGVSYMTSETVFPTVVYRRYTKRWRRVLPNVPDSTSNQDLIPGPLRGRAALAEGTEVTIEGDSGAGFQPVASALVAADGTFVVNVSPKTTTTYRAVRDSMTSPSARLTVVNRRVVLTHSRRAGRDHLTIRVLPASPGSTVVLQLNLHERFGWWPVRQVRLGRSSMARFSLANNRRVSARAALTLSDGATQLALSRRLRIGPR